MMHRRFPEVDVLRGMAALTVVLSHYLPYWNRYLENIWLVLPNSFGFYAVKLFFIISGFVILITVRRCKRVVDFAVLRFSRLFPVYWASLAFVTLVQVFLFGDRFWAGGFIMNATMLQEFFGYDNFDEVYWSLTVEVAFYVQVCLLLAFGLSRRIRQVVFIWLFLTAIWVVTCHDIGLITRHDVVDSVGRDWLAHLCALDYSPYFSVGMLFFYGHSFGWKGRTFALMFLAFAVEFLLASWEGLALISAFSLLFALAISGRLRFLANKITIWLGSISYSLYLVHRNLGYHLLGWLHDHSFNASVAICIAMVGALVLATVFTFAVERPALRIIRSFYDRFDHSTQRASGAF